MCMDRLTRISKCCKAYTCMSSDTKPYPKIVYRVDPKMVKSK